MAVSTFKSNGASANGGPSKLTHGESMMSLNAVVARTPLSSEMLSRVIRDTSIHLATWSTFIPEATFRIVKIGDLVYLETNNAELHEKYMQQEEAYVAYLIEPYILTVDELEMRDSKQAA